MPISPPFGTSAVYIDLASDTIFIFGATVNDTITVSFAETDAIAHGPVVHIAAVVAIHTVTISFTDADAITHGSVARIDEVAADSATVARGSYIKDRNHPSVGKHNRMEPITR